MLRKVFFTFISIFASTLAAQVPLQGSAHSWHLGLRSPFFNDENTTTWDLEASPSPDVTDHLVFETVHSLLQIWPNTRMRNGHNIVPGTIAKGTLLYHGAGRGQPPAGPEWVATDPEHSYYFCMEKCSSYLTLMAIRPLKIVYFDGTSAAKLEYGTMDTQDLIAWDRLAPADLNHEKPRIEALCRWGRNFGVDGFVRMEMDFEIALCDFASSISVVSSVDLTPSIIGVKTFSMFEAINFGSVHGRFPGETRIQLDLAGLVSFYDTALAPSLVPIRAGQERWDHRAGNVSSKELSVIKSRLEAALIRPEGQSSGIDWKTLFQVIVDRYAQRLELIRYLLDSLTAKPDRILDLALKAQSQLRVILTPYLILSATPANPSDPTMLDWASPIYKLCAATHIYSAELELDSMTDGEKLLLQAARETNREICRVVTKMWTAGVYAGIDPLVNTKEFIDIGEITRLHNTWTDDLSGLMSWLDWSVWVKCNPDCSPEEMCYLPMWPLGFPEEWLNGLYVPDASAPDPSGPVSFNAEATAVGRPDDETRNVVKPDIEDWVRPQPRCIERFNPFGFMQMIR